MSKQLDSVSVTFPRSNSWEDDDDEFMQSVREDSNSTSKKFAKNTQPSASWSKPEVEKRPASVTGVQWSMPNLAARPAASPSSNGTSVRFDALSPSTRKVASWRGR